MDSEFWLSCCSKLRYIMSFAWICFPFKWEIFIIFQSFQDVSVPNQPNFLGFWKKKMICKFVFTLSWNPTGRERDPHEKKEKEKRQTTTSPTPFLPQKWRKPHLPMKFPILSLQPNNPHFSFLSMRRKDPHSIIDNPVRPAVCKTKIFSHFPRKIMVRLGGGSHLVWVHA